MSLLWQRLRRFNQIWDERFEDLKPDTWLTTTSRDFSAGLIVAMTAIPMGLKLAQGVIAGGLACLMDRTWGGSKYQVNGPTAIVLGSATAHTLADSPTPVLAVKHHGTHLS